MARRQVGLKRQAEINELYQKVESKFNRQEHSHEGLTARFIEERFGEGLLEKPNFDKMTSKQATEYINNAKDYLSRKGNISTVSNEGFAWSTDVAKLKKLTKSKSIGDIIDEAFDKRNIVEYGLYNGKLVRKEVKKEKHYGEDPGIVPTTFEIGNETYGYQGKAEHSYTVIDSQEKLVKSIAKLKQKKKFFNAKKIVQAKENYLKTFASEIGLDYSGDVEEMRGNPLYAKIFNALSNISPSQFYYMQKTSDVFDYHFWYERRELEEWIATFESEVERYEAEFESEDEDSPYRAYESVLKRYGVK